MDLNIIKEKIKLDKWYLFIPIFGIMAYSMRIEMYMSKVMLADIENKSIKKDRKTMKKYKTICDLAFMIVVLPFFIVGLVMKHDLTHVLGIAWTFWVSIGFAALTMSHPFLQFALYNAGYKKVIHKENKKA